MRRDLRTWAKSALDNNQDQPDIAAAWLASRRDANLKDHLMRLGAQQVIRSFFTAQRASAMTMATGRVMATINDPNVADRVAARQARQAFWDAYTLFGMTPIREATREQLETSASQREGQARGELRLASFERDIAVRLKAGRRVCDVFTSEEVAEIAAKWKDKSDV
jgi:hypothetical protein